MSVIKENKSDVVVENVLRPQKLSDFFGQDAIKDNLYVYIGAAKKKHKSLDHVLLYGASGLGKTTLATVIANELGRKITYISGPSIEKIGDIAGILTLLEPYEVLFIDEIHRLPRVVEEFLYSAMEDFRIDIIVSKEKSGENMSLVLAPFTLIGSTTKMSNLSYPFRQRFGIPIKLEFYKVEELEKIIKRSAHILGDKIDDYSAHEIAIRSRGTPRIANRILRRVSDFSTYSGKRVISAQFSKNALERIGIDPLGLDEIDLQFLSQLITRFNGGPVGIETIAASIGEDAQTLEDVSEPYLLSIGFINRTKRGREITKKGKAYFMNNHFALLKEQI